MKLPSWITRWAVGWTSTYEAAMLKQQQDHKARMAELQTMHEEVLNNAQANHNRAVSAIQDKHQQEIKRTCESLDEALKTVMLCNPVGEGRSLGYQIEFDEFMLANPDESVRKLIASRAAAQFERSIYRDVFLIEPPRHL